MIVTNGQSSKTYNTFGISVQLSTLVEINHKEELELISKRLQTQSYKILGGGSNILLTQDVQDPVLHMNTKGIEIIKDSEDYVLVRLAAGEVWHEVVMWAVQHGYGGIENLALIPGKCGAAPMQNIGAYGVEIKDVLHAVSAFNLAQGKEYVFHKEECEFGYRTSNFKTKWKGQYIITDIILRLTKPGYHQLNTSYGAIQKELEAQSLTAPTIKDVSDTVIAIRQSKLPNPSEIGNAGSFFKNPVIAKTQFDDLAMANPAMPSYPVDEALIKIPAAWLIDQCG